MPAGVRPGSIARAMTLCLEPLLMVDSVQHGLNQSFSRPRQSGQSVEYELGDLRVVHQLQAAEHLEVPRHRGLWLPEDDLEIGNEQGTRGEAIQNAKPGRLGERDQQFGW